MNSAPDQPKGKPPAKRKWSKLQFFIVFSPEGTTAPVVVHETHKAALSAAWQMTKIHPDQKFYVMGSMSKACTASAIEARSDATPKSGAAEGESAVAKPDAQTPSGAA